MGSPPIGETHATTTKNETETVTKTSPELPNVLGDALALSLAKQYLAAATTTCDRLWAAGNAVPPGEKAGRYHGKVLRALQKVRSPWVLDEPCIVPAGDGQPAYVTTAGLRATPKGPVVAMLTWCRGKGSGISELPLRLTPHGMQRLIQSIGREPAAIIREVQSIGGHLYDIRHDEQAMELHVNYAAEGDAPELLFILDRTPEDPCYTLRTVIREVSTGGGTHGATVRRLRKFGLGTTLRRGQDGREVIVPGEWRQA